MLNFHIEGFTRELPSPHESGREPCSPSTEYDSYQESSPPQDPSTPTPSSPLLDTWTPKPTRLPPNPQTPEHQTPHTPSSTPSPASISAPSTSNPGLSPPWSPPPPPLCTEIDCPITIPHRVGIYLHKGEPPEDEYTIFRHSNPPPEIWDSVDNLERGVDTVEEIDALLVFVRLHGKRDAGGVGGGGVGMDGGTPLTVVSGME